MNNFTIIQARENEIPVLEGILTDAVEWLNAMGQPLWSAEQVQWKSLSESYRIEDFYIIYSNGLPSEDPDGLPSGCMALIDHDPFFWPDVPKGDSLFVHKLAVTKSARKTGAADALIRFFKEQGAARGAKTLRLDVHAYRPRLRAFYERHGFVCVAEKTFNENIRAAFYAYAMPKPGDYQYREAGRNDIETLTGLLHELFDYHTYEELLAETRAAFDESRSAFFLAFDGDGMTPVGVCHAALRDEYVNGKTTDGTAGYLEAIYVKPGHRRRGVAAGLAAMCEDWARRRGCREFLSDCLLDNLDSYRFHLRIGFAETERCIFFRKEIVSFVNPPETSPENIFHKTFYSKLLRTDVGYNIYLPPGYDENDKLYPVAYHLHGYKGNESSEIWAVEKVCKNRNALTVFVNGTSSDNGYGDKALPIESVVITELIPHIDAAYRTDANRSLSGFSMGGAGCFAYAVKHPGLFGAVTAYAGTYHHWFPKGVATVGEPPEKAPELLAKIMDGSLVWENEKVLELIERNAAEIRERLRIEMRIGTDDGLYCDNEIMRLFLESLDIPHEYKVFDGAGHVLEEIV